MVQAWYMTPDESIENPKAPNCVDHIDIEDLQLYCGVEPFCVLRQENDEANIDEQLVENIKTERKITYEDQITISRDKIPNFDDKMNDFYREHIHTDDEIRLVVDGSGYFDARVLKDESKWVRIHVKKGDLLIIPAGAFHRFITDENEYIVAKRFFVGEPVWTPYYRPGADQMECRKKFA